METVNFSGNEFENLSNFSSHQIEYNSIIFPTCEHLYHYLKYGDTEIQNKILSARSPSLVHKISQENKNKQIDGFSDIKIKLMKKIFLLKIEQHRDVYLTLINSEKKLIIKQHPDDYFWGVGSDNSGKNVMGKLWEEVRNELY